MKTVKELQERLNVKRQELAEIFEKATKKVDGEDRYDLTTEQLEDVKKRNIEIDDIAKELEEAKATDAIYLANAKAIKDGNRAAAQLPLGGEAQGRQGSPQPGKSLGEMFVESAEYRERKSNKHVTVDFPEVDVKTLMTTAAGFAPESVRTGKVVDYAHRRPVVADMIPQTPTDQAAILYMEETTFTNAAAPSAEGGELSDSALAYTQRSAPVELIGTYLPVTEVQIEDAEQVSALINNRLLTMLELTKEVQLLTGTGTSPELKGILPYTGVQVQAKGADPTPDAIYKAMTLVRHTGFAEPSGLVIHPNDWQAIRLLRTTHGIYIWGPPSEPGPERVWGLPVVITTAEIENTGLLGDFQLYAEIFNRRGAEIKVSDSHSDYFIKNKLAIKATVRLALAIYRAAAFCMVTGI